MTNLKVERRHHILTPCDPALVLEQPVTTVQKPYLLSESSRNLKLHIDINQYSFKLFVTNTFHRNFQHMKEYTTYSFRDNTFFPNLIRKPYIYYNGIF
jgi:hypothetical protein